jgi:hypothetical protein
VSVLWPFRVYTSEVGKKDAELETKKRSNCDLNPKSKDGLDSKWQPANKKQVGDGTGTGNTVRACVKGTNKQVDYGTGDNRHREHGEGVREKSKFS